MGKGRVEDEMEVSMTPQWARLILKKRFDNMPDLWITTELIGASKKKKSEHAARQERERLTQKAKKLYLQHLIELDDDYLQFLLDNEWDPRDPFRGMDD